MRPVRNFIAGAVTVAALTLGQPTADAAESAHCTLASTGLNFGRYVASESNPIDITAALQIVCTTTSPTPVWVNASVALSGGAGPVAARRFSEGLRYQLFVDPARTIVWGDLTGSAGARPIAGLISREQELRIVVPVYGRLLARQSWARVGRFLDVITATISY